jgi:hypothetical protein
MSGRLDADRGEPRRYRRDRIIPVVLVLGPFMAYAGGAVATARQIARRDALQGNQATAELGARLIDAQCMTALAVLRSLAEQPPVAAAMQYCQPAQQKGPRTRLMTERAVLVQHLDAGLQGYIFNLSTKTLPNMGATGTWVVGVTVGGVTVPPTPSPSPVQFDVK